MQRLVCAARAEGTHVVRILALLLVAMFCGIPAAQAQFSGWHLDPIAAWGGPVNAVHVEGDLAYVGSGQRLVVVNIADPANTFEIGAISLGSTVRDFVVRDGYAFVATANAPYRFCTVDLSDPSSPRLAWFPDNRDVDQPREVDLYGSIAFVREGTTVYAYDITNPEGAIFVGEVRANVNEIVIVGDRMYVARYFDQFAIYDLSGPDPTNPPLLGAINFGWGHEVQQIAVEGDRAYAIVWHLAANIDKQRLIVLNVSDPTLPAAMGSVEVTNRITKHGVLATDLDVAGGTVYVADWANTPGPSSEGPGHGLWERSGGVIAYDVATDPSAPVQVGNFKTHGAIRGVKIIGDRAFLFDEGEGLVITDIGTDPAHPARLGMYHSPAILRQIAKDGDLLYVTDAWNGFTILDVSDPLAPVVVGIYQTNGIDGTPETGGLQDHWGIEIRDGLAFLAAGWGGIEVVDISSPTNPTLWTSFPFNLCVKSVALKLHENIAHVGTTTCTGGGFFVNFDISNLPEIVERGALSLGSPPLASVPSGVSDIDVFVARQYSQTVPTVRCQDPDSPVVIAEGPPGARDLAMLDANTLCLANPTNNTEVGGLYVMDASSQYTAGLRQIAHVPFGVAGSVAAQNGRAYVVGNACPWDQCGLRTLVFDLADPSSPQLLAIARAGAGSEQFTDIHVDEPYTFVATGRGQNEHDSGLIILELFCPADFNHDGNVNTLDFLAFLNAFNIGAPEADFNADGRVDTLDFLAFLNEFNLGCP